MTLVEEEKVTEEVGFSAALVYLVDAIQRGMPEPNWIYAYGEIAWMIEGPVTEEVVKERMAEIRAYLPPVLVWEKQYGDWFYEQRAKIWGFQMRILTDRGNACRKVVKGTEVVQVPDPDYVAPEVPTVAREVEIVEWVCGDDSSMPA